MDNPCEREIVHDEGEGGEETLYYWDGAPLHHRGRSRSPRGGRSRSPSYEQEVDLDYSESEAWADDSGPGTGSWQFPGRRDLDEPRTPATLPERRPGPTSGRLAPAGVAVPVTWPRVPARPATGRRPRHGFAGPTHHGPAA